MLRTKPPARRLCGIDLKTKNELFIDPPRAIAPLLDRIFFSLSASAVRLRLFAQRTATLVLPAMTRKWTASILFRWFCAKTTDLA